MNSLKVLGSANLGPELENLFSRFYFRDCEEIDFEDQLSFEKVLAIFQIDYNRYFQDEVIYAENFYKRVELIGILMYRLAHHYFKNNKEDWANHYSNLGRLIAGFEIYYSATIGEGLKINHGLGTVIGARTIIGNNALIHQNVTFGDKDNGRPTLKDGVTVYAGAKILGNITCGNHSIVGANCVCFIDVPDNSAVVGIPGKIIKK